MKVIGNSRIVLMDITISIEKIWKYIGHLPTIVMIHEISYKIFIYIFKLHDIEFFIEGFCTVSRFRMQNDTQNLVL